VEERFTTKRNGDQDMNREKFELWAMNKFELTPASITDGAFYYQKGSTESAWRAWQAGAAAERKELDSMICSRSGTCDYQ
jgi:hypothetical protein